MCLNIVTVFVCFNLLRHDIFIIIIFLTPAVAKHTVLYTTTSC